MSHLQDSNTSNQNIFTTLPTLGIIFSCLRNYSLQVSSFSPTNFSGTCQKKKSIYHTKKLYPTRINILQ